MTVFILYFFVNVHCTYMYSDVVECELTFAGLIVMQNRLKPETSPVIRTLLKADIRTLMITGTLYMYMCVEVVAGVCEERI